MFDQLPGDGRHPARRGDLFALDQGHPLKRVPFAHQHQASAVVERAAQRRRAAGDVEHRHDQQGHPLRRIRVRRGRRLAPAQEGPRQCGAGGHDIGCHGPVRAKGALGLSGGAGGVEDGRRVIRQDRRRRQRQVRQIRPTVHRSDHGFEVTDARIRERSLLPAHIDGLDGGAVRQVLENSVQPFGIDDGDPGAGICEAILQLRARPPRVQRRDDGAEAGGSEEGHRPFRQVAHDQRDAVALADAIRGQLARPG
jgi:hypothetical protein